MNLSKRLFALSVAPVALAFAAAGGACSSDTDLRNAPSDAAVDAPQPDAATPDAGPSTDAATIPDAAPTTDAGPRRCSDLGEASGTTVTVVPAMAPATTAYSIDENCGGVHYTRTASLANEVRRCPYTGCVAAAIDTYPVQRGGTMLVAAGARIFTGESGDQSSTLSVGPIDLAAPQTIVSYVQGYRFRGPLTRWGTEVVFERNWYGTGTPRELFLSQSGSQSTPVLSIVNAANGAIGFTARSATEGYVFAAGGASQSGPRNELTKLTRGGSAPARVEAVAPATITGNDPMQTWLAGLSQIVALPEALLVVRNVNDVLDLRTCDYAAATPCATEVANATPTATLTGRFVTAHDRVYAVRTVGGQASLVQCASSAFVAGTCTWAPFGPPIPAGATYGTFDSDDDHLYAMVIPSSGSPEVLRIAR